MESFSYRQSAQILFDIGLAMISDGKKTDMVQQKYDQGKNMCERDCDIMRRQGLIKLALRYLKIELRNDYKNYNKIFNYLYNAYLDIAMELLEKKDTQLGIHVYMDVIEDLCKADPKGPILGLNCRPLLRRALIDLKEPKLTDINELAPVRDAILNAFESQTS